MVCQFEFKVISGHLVWLRKSLSKHFMIDRNPCKQLKNNQFYSSFMFKKKKKAKSYTEGNDAFLGEYFQCVIDSGTVTSGSS